MSSAKQIVDVPFPQVDVKGVPEHESVAETVATSLTASSLMLVKASVDECCHSTAQTSEAARRPP